MKTVTIKAYTFDELTKEAKQKTLSKLSDINVTHNWWETVYEDAKNIGLDPIGFDIDRGRYFKLKFIESAIQTAQKITEEHGEATQTEKLATRYLLELPHVSEDDLYDFNDRFKDDLSELYLDMLTKEYEYLITKEAIIETIEANEYLFSANGEQLPIVTHMKDSKAEKFTFNGEECQIN